MPGHNHHRIRNDKGQLLPKPTVKPFNQYEYSRKLRMEEMLIKTRGKLKYLIQEAKDLGLTHLLTNEEMFGKPD